MKKYILGIISYLIIYSANSQNTEKGMALPIQYTTFVDSIMPVSNVSLYDSKIIGLKTDENYIIFSRYSDGGYGHDYNFTKVNADGQIVTDTVISLSVVSNMPYPYISSIQATEINFTAWSNFENFMNKQQPMIVNTDLDGNFNWAKYYEIDSLYFDVTGGFRTLDDGYLTYGYYGASSGQNNGFIIKSDNNGAIVWSKSYAALDSLYPLNDYTTQITHAIETPDSGFLFTQLVPDGGLSAFPAIVKLDVNGNLQWKKMLEFLSPISNFVDGGTMIRGLNKADEDNYLLSMSVKDTILAKYAMGSIKFNYMDGSISSTFIHTIDSSLGDLTLEKVILMPDSSYVCSYNANQGSSLFKLDKNLGVTQSISHREAPVGSGDIMYSDISSTLSGGVLAVANRISWIGLMLFKTNKNLETYCPNTDYPLYPVLQGSIGVVERVMLDTSYSLSFTANDVFLSTPKTHNSTAYNSCMCNSEIKGQVSINAIPTDSVNVVAYFMGDDGVYRAVNQVETNTNGDYSFNYLDFGYYLVKAYPSTVKYPNYLPSFYNSLGSAVQWSDAEVISKYCDTSVHNIELIPKNVQPGAWQCNGYVLQGENSTYTRVPKGHFEQIFAPGEPIPDIDITIDQSPGGTVSSTTTDANGYYAFTGLSNNNTYVVKANLPGFPNDSVYTFTVSPGDGAMDSLIFYVGDNTVYILEDSLVSVELLDKMAYDAATYPNPTKDDFNLVINSVSARQIQIELVNTLGNIIVAKKQNLIMGVNKIEFEISGQPSGIYLVRIKDGDNYHYKKVIKQ